jgi:hypothetical protein
VPTILRQARSSFLTTSVQTSVQPSGQLSRACHVPAIATTCPPPPHPHQGHTRFHPHHLPPPPPAVAQGVEEGAQMLSRSLRPLGEGEAERRRLVCCPLQLCLCDWAHRPIVALIIYSPVCQERRGRDGGGGDGSRGVGRTAGQGARMTNGTVENCIEHARLHPHEHFVRHINTSYVT